jgi:hypothetical protein
MSAEYRRDEVSPRNTPVLLSDPYPTIRGREGSISTNKVKNNFLAAVLILTIIPPSVKVGQGVINRCCFLIAEKLSDAHEVSRICAVGYLGNIPIGIDGGNGSSLRKDIDHSVCLWQRHASPVYKDVTAWDDRVRCQDCRDGSR